MRPDASAEVLPPLPRVPSSRHHDVASSHFRSRQRRQHLAVGNATEIAGRETPVTPVANRSRMVR